MRTLIMLGILGTLVLGTAATAVAQDRSRADQDVTEFNFIDELVRGDHVGPAGEVLEARRRRPRETLIQARSHFIPELYQSVERL